MTLRELVKCVGSMGIERLYWEPNQASRATAALIVKVEELLPNGRGKVLTFDWDGERTGYAIICISHLSDLELDTPLPFPLRPVVYNHQTDELKVVRADVLGGLVRGVRERSRSRLLTWWWWLKARLIATLYVWGWARWDDGAVVSWRWVGRRR